MEKSKDVIIECGGKRWLVNDVSLRSEITSMISSKWKDMVCEVAGDDGVENCKNCAWNDTSAYQLGCQNPNCCFTPIGSTLEHHGDVYAEGTVEEKV